MIKMMGCRTLFIVLISISIASAEDDFPNAGAAVMEIPGEFLALVQPSDVTDPETGKVDNQKLDTQVNHCVKKLKDDFNVKTTKKCVTGNAEILMLKGDKDKVQAAFEAMGDIKSIEPNKKVGACKDSNCQCKSCCTKQETSTYMWGLDRIDQLNRVADPDQGKYWYPSASGDPVDAYIVDTGIDINHQLFEGRAQWGYTTPFMPYGPEPDTDGHGHGTHVAGTVGSSLYGVAKDVQLYAVKVLDGNGWGTTQGVVDGMAWALQDHQDKNNQAFPNCVPGKSGKCHKSVVNVSLGGFGYSPSKEAIINAMVEEGMVVVVAAGNDAADSCFYSPAGVRSAITVGATGLNDEIKWWSNFGDCVDVFAPGSLILSTWPNNQLAISSGTSMACPHVAGVVANYLKTTTGPVTPESVRCWLRQSGTIRNKVSFETCSQRCSDNKLIYQKC